RIGSGDVGAPVGGGLGDLLRVGATLDDRVVARDGPLLPLGVLGLTDRVGGRVLVLDGGLVCHRVLGRRVGGLVRVLDGGLVGRCDLGLGCRVGGLVHVL